jgi:hypothetical protein
VTFFFRKEILAVCDQEFLVARAGIIHAREIYLVENAVAEREPNLAMQVKGRTNS